jgi:hypothetical protein
MSTYKKIFSLALLLSVLAFANTRVYAKRCDASDRCSTSRSGDCDTDCDRSRDCDDDCDTFSRDGDCDTECFRNGQRGKTFLNRRSESFNSLYELSLTDYHVYHSNSYCGPRSTVGFYVTPFYKENTRRRRHDHFLKSGFSFDGDTQTENTRDFKNRRPRHGLEERIYGAVFTIYADLGGLLCDGFWGNINFAAVGVERKLCRFKDKNRKKDETVVTANTLENGVVGPCTETVTACTTIEDFKRRCHKDQGVDDIQVKLGYDYFLCNNDHVGFYIVGGIPTHRRDHKDDHLFKSRVGSRHGSFGFGLNTDYTLWQGCASNLNWLADVKYRYVFRADERRPLNSNFNCKVTDSECIRVRPGSTIDFWTALHYEHCCWNLEAGYNLYFRDKEKICFRNNKDRKHHDTKTGTVTVTACNTKPLTDAVNGAATDAHQNGISTNNIRGESRHDRALDNVRNGRVTTHTVYGALGYSTSICNYPTLLGVAGSYEFARCREAFDYWSVFGKIGVQF